MALAGRRQNVVVVGRSRQCDVVPARAVSVSSHHRPHPPASTAFVGCKSHRRGIVPAPAANVPLHYCLRPPLSTVCIVRKSRLWCVAAAPAVSVPSHHRPCLSASTVVAVGKFVVVPCLPLPKRALTSATLCSVSTAFVDCQSCCCHGVPAPAASVLSHQRPFGRR